KAQVGRVQRRRDDAETGEAVGPGALRKILAPQRIDPEAQLVEDPRVQRLRQPDRRVLPLIEDRDAETRQIATAHRKWLIPIVATEAVSQHQRASTPYGVIGLDRELKGGALGERRCHEVGLWVGVVRSRIETGGRPTGVAQP